MYSVLCITHAHEPQSTTLTVSIYSLVLMVVPMDQFRFGLRGVLTCQINFGSRKTAKSSQQQVSEECYLEEKKLKNTDKYFSKKYFVNNKSRIDTATNVS